MASVLSRIHNRRLSAWQSSALATAQADHKATGKPLHHAALLAHPIVQAVNNHVDLVRRKQSLPKSPSAQAKPDPIYLSILFLELAVARQTKDDHRVANLEVEVRKYSTADTSGWLTCATNFAYFGAVELFTRPYVTWKGTSQGLQFSVIDYQLPNDAVVAILGDWGTGQSDAVNLLTTIMNQHKPDAIVHLGDIYYAGTPSGYSSAPDYQGECQTNFLEVFTTVFDSVLGEGKRIPVFTIPGNHEYYSWAVGFFNEVLPQVNSYDSTANQPASFFALRTEDQMWQFLGMDTGYNDNDPAYGISPVSTLVAAPALESDEVPWHQDKLNNFPGATVLLSHHQFYSANATLNGSTTGDTPYLNTSMPAVFASYFSTRIAAWLWGHEHNLVLYQNGLAGLQVGRLIGCSAYEETTGENPYQVNNPEVPYLSDTEYQLGSSQGYYNHGYAVMDFTRQDPSDPISISYYQYPSWGDPPPDPIPTSATWIYTENLSLPVPSIGNAISYGDDLTMMLYGYGYLATIDQSDQHEYYPMLNPNSAVVISFVGQSGQLQHGSVVQIQTSESQVGDYNLLGAWSTPALYYYKSGWKQEYWTIYKRDTSSDNVIHYGDDFYLVNNDYEGQWMTALIESGASYLTTSADATYSYWVAQQTNSDLVVNAGDAIRLKTGDLSIGPIRQAVQYFPTLTNGDGIDLYLRSEGRLTHGATITIETREEQAGNYDKLIALEGENCFYYTTQPTQSWKIWKIAGSKDNLIRKGDTVYFTNNAFEEAVLTADPETNFLTMSPIRTKLAHWVVS